MIDHEEVVRLAGALWLGYQRLESKLDAHTAHLGRGRRRRRDRAATVAYLRDARRRILRATARAERELDDAVRHGATPEQIALSVTRCTEQLLDVAAAARHQPVPDDLQHARELTARLVDRPLRSLTAFVEGALAALEPAPPGDRPPGGDLALDPVLESELGPLLGQL